ncbi:MAG: hypothetical protein ACK6D1_01625, partial [Planctomycetota bacterium]
MIIGVPKEIKAQENRVGAVPAMVLDLVGAVCLEKHYGGRGILLGGIPGVEPATVVILGGGVVGTNAAKMAAGL